jgi:hypothetical protein
MVEMVVAVGVLIVFMASFTGISVSLMQTLTISNANAKTASDQTVSLGVLGTKVMYADTINAPGAGSSGAVYVEFRSPASSAGTTSALCTQFRYSPSDKSIASRSWISDTTPSNDWRYITQSKVLPIENSDVSTYPFTVNSINTSDSSADYRAMQSLTIAYHEGSKTTSTFMSKTINAVNSNTSAHSTANVCEVSGSLPRD